jgi:hypothetical protein
MLISDLQLKRPWPAQGIATNTIFGLMTMPSSIPQIHRRGQLETPFLKLTS